MSELCSECKNHFDLKIRRPILLECGCTYCLDCVHKQIKDDPNREIICPLPLHGVSTMPDNLAEKENKSILTNLLSFDDLTVFCDDHSKHKATLYCTVCSIPVCPRCINSTHKKHSLIDLKKSKFQTFATNVQRLYEDYSSENIKSQLELQSLNKCTLKASELKLLLCKIQRVLGNIVSDEECQQIDLAYYLNGTQNVTHDIYCTRGSDRAEEVKALDQIKIEDIKLLINDSQIQLREEFKQTLNAIENNQRLVNDSIRTNQVKADDKIDKLQRDIETNLSQRLDELGSNFQDSNLRTTKLQELVQNLTDDYSKQLQLLNSQIIETNNDFTSFKYAVKQEIDKYDAKFVKFQEKIENDQTLLDIVQLKIQEVNNNLHRDSSHQISQESKFNIYVLSNLQILSEKLNEQLTKTLFGKGIDDLQLKPYLQIPTELVQNKHSFRYLVEIEIKKQDSSLLQTQIPNFSRQSFKLLYRGSIDGFKASKFHQLCDNKGPTVIFMLSEYDLVLGGYASISLASPSDYKWCSDPSAFVFSLSKRSIHKQYQNQDRAVYHLKDYMCVFGRDISIKDDCDKNSESFSNLGYTYEPPKGYKQGSVEASSYLAGENKFKVLEIEVYSLQ